MQAYPPYDPPNIKKGRVPKILILAANPCESSPRELAEEHADIQRGLREAHNRDDFRFESRWAITVDDLMCHLMELDPVVIHFSGHGSGDTGLMVQNTRGQPHPVSARALAVMVSAAARNTRVVVLNACYSRVHAEALRAKVDCVVGMDAAIGEEAARAFARKFYSTVVNGGSIANAVSQGTALLAAERLPEGVLPRYLTRDGVDAYHVVLGRTRSEHKIAHRPTSNSRKNLQTSSLESTPGTTTIQRLHAFLKQSKYEEFRNELARAESAREISEFYVLSFQAFLAIAEKSEFASDYLEMAKAVAFSPEEQAVVAEARATYKLSQGNPLAAAECCLAALGNATETEGLWRNLLVAICRLDNMETTDIRLADVANLNECIMELIGSLSSKPDLRELCERPAFKDLLSRRLLDSYSS